MSKTYQNHKEIKKNFALKGIGLLAILALIFTAFLIRFAFSGSRTDFMEGSPSNDDVYSIARQFVRPTIKSDNVSFPESDYQCAQKPDSIFIVKSYAESKNDAGAKNVTTYEITLKFTGGKATDKSRWKLIDINEN